MSNSNWILSSGTELPEPDVPIYLPKTVVEAGQLGQVALRRERPSKDLAEKALNTYRWANDNAVALLEEARLLASKGRDARAFALAATALEEIGKSQYAADVYTGFVPPNDFDKLIRQHEFKSAYPSRFVEFGPLVQPFLKDWAVADEVFARRNQALYASPSNRIDDAAFQRDAATMIDYCQTWVDRIWRQEAIAERIGTKAFIK